MSNGDHHHDQKPTIPTVLAFLPECPACGAKDRAHRIRKTYRPFGPDNDEKVQYVVCRCGEEFKIDWE